MKNKFTIILLLLLIIGSIDVVFGESLPTDFPPITVTDANNPAPGYYFLGDNSGKMGGVSYGNYIMILDNDGIPQAYRKIGNGSGKLPRSFQQVSCGLITYTEETTVGQLGMVCDENLNKLDSFPKYNTGRVDILPNGHYLLTEKENIPMDLSLVFAGGEPNATLAGNKVYELDKDKNIVFLWRTTDYYDLHTSYSDSLGAKYDFCHTNMIVQDYDGNFLISQRNFSTITKVNKQTGEIIWKLGGKQNQFSFIGENESNAPNYFSYQHHVRRAPNGNITMFDNGVQHSPTYSRGVEYKIDEVNKTATMVWEYRQSPNVAAKAEGSVETLPNGNKVIGWGEASSNGGPALTELKPDNSIAEQIFLPTGYKSMMASKFAWKSDIPIANLSNDIIEGQTYDVSNSEQSTCVVVKVNKLITSAVANLNIQKFNFAPKYPAFNENPAPMVKAKRVLIKQNNIDSIFAEYRFKTLCLEITYKPEDYKVYQRDTDGQGIFIQLPTVYDMSTGDLIVNTSKTGEFIFGIPQPEAKPSIPVLVSPNDLEKVNQAKPVNFAWSPHGYFTDSRLLVATDKEFTNLVIDSVVKGIKFSYPKFKADQQYYWKLQTINVNTPSDWSEIRSFNTTTPYVKISVPNGGEIWEKYSVKYIIRWNKNIDDMVRIELLKNNWSVLTIKDSLKCPTGAFAWKIPADLTTDSIYVIRVTSLTDGSLYSESQNVFTIKDKQSSVDDNNSDKHQYTISPNPATNSITISLNNDLQPLVKITNISICNSRGIEVKRFTENELLGRNTIDYSTENLPSGIYYCTIKIDNHSITNSFVVVK